MKKLLPILILIPIISYSQQNPYFSKQENIQMQRERDRWMSNLEDYSRQPNVKYSRNAQFESYLKNLDSQIEEEKNAREAVEQKSSEETWARWERNSAERERRESEQARISYQKRVDEITRNTEMQRQVVNQAREKLRDQLKANDSRALALLGIISYPVLTVSRDYIEKAFRLNPGEYAPLVAVSDYLNNPYPDTQNEYFRVIKIAELSSKEGYMPFRFYSCVLIKKSLDQILKQNVTKKATEYAQKRFNQCMESLPAEYRNSPSFDLLVKAQTHFQPATHDFWTDTNEGLNVEAIKAKIQKMPFLGNPLDFYQRKF